jgi:predicted nucleotidyltransferase
MPANKSTEIERIVSSLTLYQPERIILFGSAARGNTDEYSDIDLIVIKDTDQRFVQRLIDVTRYLPKDTTVDVLVYTPDEIKAMVEEGNPFILKALEEGKVLYENPRGNS